MKLIGICLIACMLIMTTIQSQTVWERLDSWEQSINEGDLSMNVDLIMRHADNQNDILDQSEMKIVQDERGYYAKLFDYEFFVEGEVGFSVDHLDKKIKVSDKASIDEAKEKLFRMKAFAKSAPMFDVVEESRDNLIYFQITLKEEDKTIIELEFDSTTNKLLLMRQFLTRKIEVKGNYYPAIVEMNYRYSANQSRPAVSDYVYADNGMWSCTPSYKSYELLAN